MKQYEFFLDQFRIISTYDHREELAFDRWQGLEGWRVVKKRMSPEKVKRINSRAFKTRDLFPRLRYSS